MAWASSCVAPRRRASVSTSWPGASGRASAFVLASCMVAYPSAWWAGGWSCNNPGYAAFFNRSSTTFDHSSMTLTLNDVEEPTTFSGPGYLRQDDDGMVTFKVYPTAVTNYDLRTGFGHFLYFP